MSTGGNSAGEYLHKTEQYMVHEDKTVQDYLIDR